MVVVDVNCTLFPELPVIVKFSDTVCVFPASNVTVAPAVVHLKLKNVLLPKIVAPMPETITVPVPQLNVPPFFPTVPFDQVISEFPAFRVPVFSIVSPAFAVMALEESQDNIPLTVISPSAVREPFSVVLPVLSKMTAFTD